MKPFRIFPLFFLLVVLIGQTSAYSQTLPKTIVVWFVGLGTGANPEQVVVEKKVVEKFNLSHDKIELRLYVTGMHVTPDDNIRTLIASGSPPDIVGPVGFNSANIFEGYWLDLQPFVDKTGYNLKQFPENVVALHREPAGLIGIPFAAFPGVMYYNVELFDKAGLAYPPARFGEKYKLDGKELDWDYDTVALIAKRLTLDDMGATPNDPGFDPSRIVQFGFAHQWDTMRSDFSTFGGGRIVNADGKVSFPSHWREQAHWLWNGIWKDYFIPNATYFSSLLKMSPFESGKVAMARSMIWFTCCIDKLKAKWDLAVVPSYKGVTYAPIDADTFRIMKLTKNPDAAFTVLQYLQGEAAADLLGIYNAFPARPDLQAAYIATVQAKFPFVQNWSILAPGLEYAVIPYHESVYPNFRKGQDRLEAFRNLIYSDAGKAINVDAEFDKLQTDLEKIIKQ